MALADGLPMWQVLDDLRHIKLSKDARARLVHLDAEFKRRGFTPAESSWLRRQYNRRTRQIKELHQMYENARETDGRIRRGAAKDKLLRLRAKRLTRRRLEGRKEQLESELRALEAEEKDFGI